jgi:predicted nucleic acid-binding protein
VTDRAIVNTSPLIYLARADLFDLLKLAGDEIVVPSAVADELKRRGPIDITVQAIENTEWLVVVETPSIPIEIQVWDLGEGESSVLAWAYLHPETDAIIDDLAARRCAKSLGIPVRGTLSLALSAKKAGKITAARPVLEKLRISGMYLSNKVMNEALALVGE